MIYSKITSGLGNQLFQWAAALSLAVRNHTEARLDLRFYKDSGFSYDKEFPRPFKLNKFKIQAQIAREEELKWLVYIDAPNRRKRLVYALLKRLKWRRMVRYVKEPSLDFHPHVLEAGASAYLDGYWASEKYFEAIADLVREQAQVRDERIREFAVQFCDRHRRRGAPLVGVQVRRGDVYYMVEVLKKTHHIPLIKRDYFLRAMEEFGREAVFLMFSDSVKDIEICRQEFAGCHNIHFVSGNDDITDFAILQRCDHQIISNSTFGWWAAWLNPNSDKMVICPQNWYAPGSRYEHNMSDLLPSRWRPL